MAPASTELRRDGLGGVRFEDADLERRFFGYNLDQSLAASKYTPWIAAFLFLVSAPFDYFFVGGNELSPMVLQCLTIRSVTVILLVASGFFIRVASSRAKSATLILGWVLSVLVIWFIAGQASPLGAAFYTSLLGLASLSTASLVPVLSFWQIRAMNLVLIIPFLSLATMHGAVAGSPDTPYFAYSALILASTIFMGLYSKRSYELALRNDFLRSLDLVVARDRAMMADRAKSDFLASVSHELRTPLNAILGNVQILSTSSGLSPDDRDMVEAARKASGAIISLVDDLLRVSSTGAGRGPVTRAVRIGAVIEDLEAVIGVLAARKALRLELPSRDVQANWIAIDPEGLRQILLNLLGNAVKFTRQGRVGLRLRLSETRLNFIVFDTGIGMEPGQVRHAFEPLFRGSNVATGEFAGTGLGLAIVDRLVTERGGSVRMRSCPGRGTIVFGWLAATAAQPAQGAVQVLTPPAAPMRILVIEDDPANRAVLKRMLVRAGHSVLEAGTGAQAVEVFESGAPDCVLSDIRLPDTDGVELLKQLTRLSQHRPSDHVPVYAVTANALPEDLIRYEEAGFDGVISKPYEERILSQVLVEIAVQKRLVDALPIQRSATQGSSGVPAELGKLYLQSMAECLVLLRKARAEANAGAIADVAHRVLGTALTRGDLDTANWARGIHENAGAGPRSQAHTLDGLEAHLSRLTDCDNC